MMGSETQKVLPKNKRTEEQNKKKIQLKGKKGGKSPTTPIAPEIKIRIKLHMVKKIGRERQRDRERQSVCICVKK